MTIGGSALHVLLATALATPPTSAEPMSTDQGEPRAVQPGAVQPGAANQDPALCAATDLRCRGMAYVAAARVATSGKQRAQYLYSAHRAFLRLFDRSQDGRDLCQAHDLIRQARKVPANQLGERLVDSERETLSRLRSSEVECSPVKSKRARRSPAAVKEPPEPAPEPEPTPVLAANPDAPSQPPVSQPVAPPPASPPPLAVEPHVGQGAPVFFTPMARPSTPLIIGGGVAIGVSLALGGVGLYLHFRGRAVLQRGIEVEEVHEDFPEFTALRRQYDQINGWGWAAAFTGGAALIAGVSMLTVGMRRRSRNLAIGPMLRPGAGGMLVTGRF